MEVGDGPPMNVVVIRGTPPSSDARGTFTSPPLSTMGCINSDAGVGSCGDRTSALPMLSSSFKLMPRNCVPAMCRPSPSSRERMSMSRKRRAQSISSPSSGSDGDESDEYQMAAMGKEDFSSPRCSPPFTEGNLLRFDGLSINSPLVKLASPPKLPSQNSFKPGPSSFSLYSFSPVTSIQRNNSGSLSGSAGSMVAIRTPCSSTKSSPKHVPLTVLSQQSSQGASQGPSPMRLPPAGRPPFHSGLSKMLHSLHGREDEEEVVSPRRTSRSLLYPPNPTTTPGAMDASCDMSEEPFTPRSSGYNVDTSFLSPSPRTPLTRVTLTPRTPLSSQKRDPNAVLPLFPVPEFNDTCRAASAPRDNDAVGMFMDDLLEGCTGQRASALSPPSRALPLLSFNPDSSNSLALSREGSPIQRTPPSTRCSGSPPGFVHVNARGYSSRFSTPVRTNTTLSAACAELSSAEAMGIKAKSVMTPSRSDGFLSEMMRAEARAGVLEAETGSLSDSDDEDFVLTCPLSVHYRQKVDKQDHQSPLGNNRRVKQRIHDQMDMEGKSSFASLNANLHASTTSLFGMDIVLEEGQSSSTPQARTASSGCPSFNRLKSLGSTNALSLRDAEYGSSSSLHRGKSELSLGSLGLCLEGPYESGRDLVTPPIMVQYAISPPPLVKRPMGSSPKQHGNNAPSSSVCIVSADKGSVSRAISQMAFQEQRKLTPT
jgi:hypothetical protein